LRRFTSSTEPIDDSDVDDAEPAGESKGETVAELTADVADSVVMVRFMAGIWGRAVVVAAIVNPAMG